MQPSPSLAHNILPRCCRCGSWTKSRWATRPRDLVMLVWSTAQPVGASSVLRLCFPPAMSCLTVWPWKVVNIIVFSMVDALLRDTNERGYSGILGWLLSKWKEQCDCPLPVLTFLKWGKAVKVAFSHSQNGHFWCPKRKSETCSEIPSVTWLRGKKFAHFRLLESGFLAFSHFI